VERTQAGVFEMLWAQGLLDYDEVRELGQKFGYTLHIRARHEETLALKRQVGYKARRWVVERMCSCTKRFRGVLIRSRQKGRELSRPPPFRLRLDYTPSCWPIGIGSK
jgi:hypothetical protein